MAGPAFVVRRASRARRQQTRLHDHRPRLARFGVNNATAINATGQVTGSAYLPNTIKVTCHYTGHYCLVHPYHAFLWDGSKMSDLGTLGFNNSVGTAINRTGQVAGWAGDVISDTNAFS